MAVLRSAYNGGPMRERASIDGLRPGPPLEGSLRPPGSKSIAQRALLAAAAARGTTRLAGLPGGEDVGAAAELASALGARLEPDRAEAGSLRVAGAGPPLDARAPLVAGESATLARLATALVAWGGGGPALVEARGSLRARASAPLFEALRRSGAGVRGLARADGWPLALEPLARAPEEARLERPASSQELSALLLAAAAHPGACAIEVVGALPSRPYVDVTIAVLERFGARVERGEAERPWRVQGPLAAPPAPLAIEADASSAAVALAAGCLSGGRVAVTGRDERSAQGDWRIVEHLRAFGCDARDEAGGARAAGRPVRGAELDLADAPDLAPVLAALAAGAALVAGARSRLTGLAGLRGKESDRLAGLARGLARAGWAAAVEEGALVVGPGAPGSAPEEVLLEPEGDHRMAFAFALLGLLRPGVAVRDAGCVAKSWPSFWADVSALGALRRAR